MRPPFLPARDRPVLVGLALGSVLFNVATIAWLGVRWGADTGRYVAAAHNIVAGHSVQWSSGDGLFVGYVGLLALCDAIGLGPSASVAFHLGPAALAALALFDMARTLAGRFAGILASVFFIVDVDIARWHAYVLADSLYISFVVLATWLVTRAVGRGPTAYLSGALGVLLTASIRPNGWVLAPIAVLYWFAMARFAPRIKYTGLILLVALCLGGAFFVSSAFGIRWTAAPGARRPPVPGETLTRRVNRWASRGFDPGRAAARVWDELAHVRSPYSLWHNTAIVALISIVYPLAVLGLVLHRNQPLTMVMAAVIGGHLAIVSLTFSDHDGRYLLYVFGFIATFAACGGVAVGRRALHATPGARA